MARSPTRFIGLDIHKEYFVAVGVNAEREVIFGPQRASNYQLDEWIQRYLTGEDAVVLRSDCDFQSEMTANAYLFYDSLLPYVHSVIVVHPANVALVTKAQVKTDKKAALALAQLHAVGLLTGVWIPPHKIRDLRSLIAQREKMVRLSTMATSSRCPSGRIVCTPCCTANTWLSRENSLHRNIGSVGKACRSRRLNSSWSIRILRPLILPKGRLNRSRHA